MEMAQTKAAQANGIRHAQMLIDGEWTTARPARRSASRRPATAQLIGSGAARRRGRRRPRGEGRRAAAFPAWSRVVPRERGRMLQKIADAIEARVEELARIIAEETGNAIRTQARPEAKGAADIFRYFGGLASELKGETIPLGEHVLSYTRREPIGVVGAIIPVERAGACWLRSRSRPRCAPATRWC